MNDDVRLVPLGHEHLAGMEAITGDPGALRFTRVPEPPPAGFAQSWIQRYLDGRASGEREAYAIVDGDGAFLGAGMIPTMDAESLTAELGYIVVSSARGRGVATRGLALLTDRALELGMKRIELWIAVANPASQKVAERCGFRLEGVMRSAYHKQGLREDTQVWSLLDTDPRPAL
jgi:RimJ/RimL family protein N-acetyltransferase